MVTTVEGNFHGTFFFFLQFFFFFSRSYSYNGVPLDEEPLAQGLHDAARASRDLEQSDSRANPRKQTRSLFSLSPETATCRETVGNSAGQRAIIGGCWGTRFPDKWRRQRSTRKPLLATKNKKKRNKGPRRKGKSKPWTNIFEIVIHHIVIMCRSIAKLVFAWFLPGLRDGPQ